MKHYIGVKRVRAMSMTRGSYNHLRGWVVPANENPDDAGFLVEYVDGGPPNTDLYTGYVSWSPKEVFEQAYRQVDGLSFGFAIEALKNGQKVARAGWNGKGMWLMLVSESMLPPGYLPYITMKTVDDKVVPWLASQTDVLAEDWRIVE